MNSKGAIDFGEKLKNMKSGLIGALQEEVLFPDYPELSE